MPNPIHPTQADSALVLGLTTIHDADAAQQLAQTLVAERLAACIHVEGPLRSAFHWDGQAQFEEEFRLLLKFPARHAEKLEKRLHELHPYDTPAWLTWKPDHTAPDFLAWVNNSCPPNP